MCGNAAPLYPVLAKNGTLEWYCGWCYTYELGRRQEGFWRKIKDEIAQYPHTYIANLNAIEAAEPKNRRNRK